MRTIRSAKQDGKELRLVDTRTEVVGLLFGDGKELARVTGTDPDEVWRQLHDEVAKANPKYFGFEGARNRFLHFFPNGFQSAEYEKEERKYKEDAKRKLDKAVPMEKAGTAHGVGEAVLSAYQTNMLSQFEQMRVRDVLRSPDADRFIHTVGDFANGNFNALRDLEKLLKAYGCAQWTVVTYLPFLWCPEKHMYLKPEATKDFAARVGHRFASIYDAGLDPSIYESLLDLADRTLDELRDLKPRDRIDVQSFIWVVGKYVDKQ